MSFRDCRFRVQRVEGQGNSICNLASIATLQGHEEAKVVQALARTENTVQDNQGPFETDFQMLETVK